MKSFFLLHDFHFALKIIYLLHLFNGLPGLARVDEEGNEPNEKSNCDDFFIGSKINESETDVEAVATPNIEVGNFFSTLSKLRYFDYLGKCYQLFTCHPE